VSMGWQAPVAVDEVRSLWTLVEQAQAPSELWEGLVQGLALATGAHCVLALVRTEGRWRILREWPEQSAAEGARPMQARRLAERAAAESGAVVEALAAQDAEPALAVRMRETAGESAVSGPEAAALVVFSPAVATDAGRAPIEALAHFAAELPSRWRHRDPHESAGPAGPASAAARAERLFEVLELVRGLGDETRFLRACVGLCNELADRFGADRVALGWVEGPYVPLQAMSHIEQFDRRMATVQQLEAALEEAQDQDADVVWPAPDEARDGIVRRAHEQYARDAGTEHLLTLPLRREDGAVAVLALERNTRAFDAQEHWELRLVADAVVARLGVLHDQDRFVGKRLVAMLRRRLAALWGPQHTLGKLVGFGLGALLLVLVAVDWMYRVEASFILRSRDVVHLPAPFDGYLAEVDVEVGDLVRPGQPLAGLDTRELVLEEASAAADVEHYRREAEKAFAEGALGDMRIALARERQGAARLALVRHQLETATLVSPLEGIVVEGDLEERLGAPVSKGDLLLRVARTDDTYVELEVPETEIHEIEVGDEGELAFVGRPDARFPLRIARIEPAAAQREGRSVFLVRADVLASPEDWWRPGMGGTARIDIEPRPIGWILTRRTIRFLREVFWL